MIRVLHITDGMNIGGQETFIMNVYRNIDRRKFQFDFIEFSDERCFFDDEIERYGGKIFRVPHKRKAFIKNFNMIASIVRKNKYDIVHRHYSQATMAVELMAAKMGGAKKLIAHSHSNLGDHDRLHYLFRPILNWVATHRFACSELAGEWMFGVKPFAVVKNGIKLELFENNDKQRMQIRDNLGVQDKFVIGHVGRMSKEKNHALLIEIIKQFREEHRNAVLMLCGDGVLRGEIEEKIKQYNLEDSCLLMGNRLDIPELLNAMDVFLYPSIEEGFGIALLEAQAAGLPCVASSTLPQSVMIHPNLTTADPLGQPSEWCDAINEVLSMGRWDNCDMLRELHFDIKDTAMLLQNIYEE